MAKAGNTRKKQQQVMEANRKCLADLTDLFNMLKEENALIGRIGLCVVVDALNQPQLSDNTEDLFFGHTLEHIDFGYLNCVAKLMQDEHYLFVDMGLLSEEPERWDDGTEIPAVSDREVPCLEAVRSLVYAIAEITGAERDVIMAAKEVSEAHFQKLFSDHAEEIRDALFSGEATDAPPKVLH